MTKKALIDTNLIVNHYETNEVLGQLVVDTADTTFDVVETLVWRDCPDNVEGAVWYYDNTNNTYDIIPVPPEPEEPTEP